MTVNLFNNNVKLRHIGKNVIIGKTVRIRYPELVEIGDNVIIDDFTYISTALKVANNVHIAAGCKLIGGVGATISIDEFSTLAPNVVLAAGSDDYIAGMNGAFVSIQYKGEVVIGTIKLGRHCIVGANTTITPNVILYNGSAVGAQSLVKTNIPEWNLYAGIPAKKLSIRNKSAILALEESYLKALKIDLNKKKNKQRDTK